MGILNWGFRANVKVHQSSKAYDLPLKSNKEDSILFTDFVRKEIPTLDESKKLWLHPLLFNGALQTLYYTSVDSIAKFPVYYGRETFEYKDQGTCSLDWAIPKPESKEEFKKLHDETLPEDSPKLHPRTRFFSEQELAERKKHGQDVGSEKPIAVVLHGLCGGSHEPLIRNFVETINSHVNGWDVLVVNNRGCCRTKITSAKLFNALSTDDVKDVLHELKKRYPSRPIYAVGFSFGACILANFLGDPNHSEEDHNLIRAAALIGCPWDLVDSCYHLQQSYSGNYLFNPALTTYLQKLVKNNYKTLSSFSPDVFTDDLYREFMKPKTTVEFDNVYTCHSAGFSNAMDYYREASPVRRIGNIKTPTLILNSTDDPTISVRLPKLEVLENPYLAMIETDLGGHLSYAKRSGDFWSVELVEEFFTKFDKVVA